MQTAEGGGMWPQAKDRPALSRPWERFHKAPPLQRSEGARPAATWISDLGPPGL